MMMEGWYQRKDHRSLRATCGAAAGSRKARPRRWLALLPLLATLAAGRPVGAAEGPEHAVAILIGPEQSAGQLRVAIEAQLSGMPVRATVEEQTDLPGDLPGQVELAAAAAARLSADTVFWFDVSVPERVFVFLSGPGEGRVLVRLIDAPSEIERIETAAIIVRGLVEAVLAGGTIDVAVPAPPLVESVPGPPQTPAQPESSGPTTPSRADLGPADLTTIDVPVFGLQLGYVLEFFSDQYALQHGMHLDLEFHLHSAWSVFLGYRVLTAVRASSAELDLLVDRHPLELGVQFEWRLGDWALGARLHGVADCLTRRAALRATGLAPTSVEPEWIGGMGLLARVGYRIGSYFQVVVEGGADVMFNQVEFAVDVGAGPSSVLVSGLLLPRILLGLRMDLF